MKKIVAIGLIIFYSLIFNSYGENSMQNNPNILIIELENKQNGGDAKQAASLTTQVINHLPKELKIERKKFSLDVDQNNKSVENINQNDLDSIKKYFSNVTPSYTNSKKYTIIAIGAGLHGAKALLQLKKQYADLIALWSGHQPYPEIENNLNKFTQVFLPSSIEINLQPGIKIAYGNKISQQFGVPFVIDSDREQKSQLEVNKFIKEQVNGRFKQVIVFQIGGDVDDNSNKNCAFHYNAENITKDLEYLISQYGNDNNTLYVILSTFRTDKYYNPNSNMKTVIETIPEIIAKHNCQSIMLDVKTNNITSTIKTEKDLTITTGISFGIKLAELSQITHYYIIGESVSLNTELAFKNIDNKRLFFIKPLYLSSENKSNLKTQDQKSIYKNFNNLFNELEELQVGNIIGYKDNELMNVFAPKNDKKKELKNPTEVISEKIVKLIISKQRSLF